MDTHKEDRRLIKAMLAGDEAAFSRFFDCYYPRIYRFCLNRLPQNDAEDVAMKTMRQAMRRIETYRAEASLLAWVYQVARSQLSAFYKEHQKLQQQTLIDDHPMVVEQLEQLAVDPILTPEGSLERRQHIVLIQSMLDHLPGDYGRVLEMKYVEGVAVEEIANRLATTTIAIQSMLARARKAFRATYNTVLELEHEAAASDAGGMR